MRDLAKICGRNGVRGVCDVMGSGLACLRTGTARLASNTLGAGMIIGALGATKTSTSAVINSSTCHL